MFRTVFSRKSAIEERNKELLTESAGKRKHSSKLSLCCREVVGKWGIWAEFESALLLITPVDLFNSIFSDYDRLYVTFIDDSDKETQAYVDVSREPYIYRWTLTSPVIETYVEKFYMQDEYIAEIKTVMTEFLDKIREGLPLAYDKFDVKPEAVQMCLEQFEVQATLPSIYTLRTSDIQKEEFVFEPGEMEEYTIGVGARRYSTYLTHEENSCEYIRHQLEEFAYAGKASIDLVFDGSETILKLEQISVLDQINESEDGVGFKYQDYIRIEIKSNCYADMPVIVGYCDVVETLTTLYTGFLQMALRLPDEPYGRRISYLSRFEAYNMFKSPIIERVLDTERKIDFSTHEVRQVHITDVLTIDPDYDVFLMHMDGSMSGDELLEELCGQPVQIEGLAEWSHDIVPAIIEAAVGKTYPMDWENFHRRGIELARQIRKVLPKEYDLWYRAPFEDKSGTIKKPILII